MNATGLISIVKKTMQNSLETIPTITQEEIRFFQENGHIVIRNLLPKDEVTLYREAIIEAVKRFNTETRPFEERDTYAKAFLQTMNLWLRDNLIKQFVFAKRFASVAVQLMQVRGVRLYHDQALFKEPHASHTPWHQDQYYWPLSTTNTITMWMALNDVDPEMGPMTFASGSHRSGVLSTVGISDESETSFGQIIKEHNFPLSRTGHLSAGDATFHAGWTLHGAPPNYSDKLRAAMTIIYFEDGATAIEPDNDNRKADLEHWLPGIKPGELAASEINPILFTRS